MKKELLNEYSEQIKGSKEAYYYNDRIYIETSGDHQYWFSFPDAYGKPETITSFEAAKKNGVKIFPQEVEKIMEKLSFEEFEQKAKNGQSRMNPNAAVGYVFLTDVDGNEVFYAEHEYTGIEENEDGEPTPKGWSEIEAQDNAWLPEAYARYLVNSLEKEALLNAWIETIRTAENPEAVVAQFHTPSKDEMWEQLDKPMDIAMIADSIHASATDTMRLAITLRTMYLDADTKKLYFTGNLSLVDFLQKYLTIS